MAGETNVGGIVGFLRLDADQFHREINQAIAETEVLDGKRVNVTVDVDRTGAAAEQFAQTERSLDNLDKSVKRVDNSSRGAHSRMRTLATAVALLGPPLVPISAGVVGLAAAFGGMGTAGVAALFGIKREMDAGTEAGLAFRNALDLVKEDLGGVASVAARNVLGPFQDAVADLHDRMPDLSDQVGDLATVTGRATGALAGGLLSAFQQLEPLIRDTSVWVLRLSERFEDAMSGPGVVEFGDYIRSVFPQVMDDIGALVGMVGHLVAALAPLGLGTLGVLRTLSDIISAIPVDVLAVLAQGATSVFLGFKTWQGLSSIIGGVTSALGGVEAMSSRAAAGVRGLQAAAGLIGVAVAGLSLIFAGNAEATRANEQATNDYADALRRTNGVIDESIRQQTAKKLADEGVLGIARELGLNLGDVTDAALGNGDAMARLNTRINQVRDGMRGTAAATGFSSEGYDDFNGKVAIVTDALGLNNEQLQGGIQKWKDIEAATRTAADATSGAEGASSRLAAQYGTSAGTYEAVKTAQQGIADKAAAATLQMQLENDAAGLLKQSLDLLNGEAVSYQTALNGFERGMLTLGAATHDADGKIDKSKTTLKGHGEAAVTNRANLLSLAQQAVGTAEAFGAQKDSAEAGRKKLIELREQILDNAEAQGLNRDEVEKFIDQVLKIPKKVPPTKADLDTAEALRKKKELQRVIDAIHGKTVTVTLHQVYTYSGLQGAQTVRNASQLDRNGVRDNAEGGIHLGGVQAMAAGGFPEGRQSRIMAATKPILWNEAPGGEAFISLAPQQRRRSLAVWEETGRRIGANAGGGGGVDYDRMQRAFERALSNMKAPRMLLDDVSRGLAGRTR